MIIDVKQDDSIPANDRLALYGDGCFTTMCVINAEIELLQAHIQRLRIGCQQLHIQFSDWQSLQHHVQKKAQQLSHAVLKVVISRGTGGRGYATNNVSEARCYVSVSDLPTHYEQQRISGICLGLSSIRLGNQPLLAGIKHCNRLEQVLIKHEIDQNLVDDVLVCDYQDNVIETSAGNLFFRKGSQWVTPKLDKCGVSGVMRNYIIEIMRSGGINVVESSMPLTDVYDCDEVFVCNSLMKVIPVVRLDTSHKQISLKTEYCKFAAWFTDNQCEVTQFG
jgi:4-amino-4-deoxychorismate lyase